MFAVTIIEPGSQRCVVVIVNSRTDSAAALIESGDEVIWDPLGERAKDDEVGASFDKKGRRLP